MSASMPQTQTANCTSPYTSEGVCSKTWQVTDKHHCLHWYDQNTGYLLVVASLICEQVIINSDYSTHISVLYAQSRDPISQYQYCKYTKSFWASLLIKPCLNDVLIEIISSYNWNIINFYQFEYQLIAKLKKNHIFDHRCILLRFREIL